MYVMNIFSHHHFSINIEEEAQLTFIKGVAVQIRSSLKPGKLY